MAEVRSGEPIADIPDLHDEPIDTILADEGWALRNALQSAAQRAGDSAEDYAAFGNTP